MQEWGAIVYVTSQDILVVIGLNNSRFWRKNIDTITRTDVSRKVILEKPGIFTVGSRMGMVEW